MKLDTAPELQVSDWLNTPTGLSLKQLRGSVVFIEAFQMLCPGCVSHALPQAKRVAELFTEQGLVVLGLHTVFEHHAAQGTREALAAFLHEYRINFPVGIDRPSTDGPLPRTMAAYQMQGTPTQILIDRSGNLRRHRFGVVDDLLVGAEIMSLLLETTALESVDPPSAI